MMIDYNLQFIEKKLSEIRTAVMHIDGNNVVKLPNDVVSFLKMDESGKLWFAAHKPRCRLRTYEQTFPVHFSFYRKGIPFFVEVSGTAVIGGIDDVSSISESLTNGAYLVKVTPHTLEYTDTGKNQSSPENWIGLVSRCTKWVTENFWFNSSKQFPLSGIRK